MTPKDRQRTTPADILSDMSSACQRAVELCMMPLSDDRQTTDRRRVLATFAPSYPQQLAAIRRGEEH